MRIPFIGKLILGILTVGQLFVGLAVIVRIISVAIPVALNDGAPPDEGQIAVELSAAMLWIVLLIGLSSILIIFYAVHAGVHTGLSTAMKVIWIVLFLVMGGFAQVVYFFMEIAPEKSVTARLEKSV